MKRCQFCAEEIQDAAVVCKHCGRDLVAAAPKKRTIGRALAIVGGVIIVLAIIGSFIEPDTRSRGSSASAPAGLANATEDQRAVMLRDVIASSGSKCSEVTKTFLQGTVRSTGAALWNATCFGGMSYAVMVNNDRRGSTRVLDCIDLRSYAGVECFKDLR